MADISKITLPSGSTYDIKDAPARADIETIKTSITGGMHFLGITTTALTDGADTNPITIGEKSVTAVSGDIAIYSTKEYVFAGGDSKWHEFGSTGSLKALAFKDSASGSYTPAGSVSQPTFTGTAGTVTVKGTAAGTISVGSGTANYTPAGSVDKPTFTGTQATITVSGTPAGTISVGTGTANYTPTGTVGAPTITVTPSTTTKYVASSANGGGSVTAGKAASCTLPSLTMSVANETLSLDWSAGSFTANTPTAVTLPSFASQTIATGISSASATQPSFTGTGAQLVFTGSSSSATGTYTPAGGVSQPTFTGTGANLVFTGSETSASGSYTPAGTVSKPTFTGSAATITVK